MGLKPIHKNVLFLFGTAALIFILLIFAFFQQIIEFSTATDKVVAQYNTVLKIKDVLTAVEEAESYKRGFLLSGEERFLQGYKAAASRLPPLMEHLGDAITDPHSEKLFHHLERLIALKVQFCEELILVRQQKGYAATRDLFISSRGRLLFGEIKQVQEQLQAHELQILQQRQNVQKEINRRTFAVSNARSFIGIMAILIAMMFMINELVIRRKAEGRAKENERRLNLALEAGQIGSWDLDLINDTAVRSLQHDRIFGYQRLQNRWGRTIFFEHVLPVDVEMVKRAFEAAMEIGILDFECRIVWPDHSIHWIAAKGHVIRDPKKGPVRMLGVVSDITESKSAEDNLKRMKNAMEESRNFFSNIINNLGDPVFVKDQQHRWVLVNNALCELLGKRYEDVIGKNEYDFVSREQADAAHREDEQVFGTRKTVMNEYAFTDPRGELHALLARKTFYRAMDGRLYIVGVITDITKLKHTMQGLNEAKAQLEETRMFLDSIIENLPNMIFVKDAKDLRFVRFNKAGEDLTGISRHEFLGKNDYDFFPKEQADFFTQKDRETIEQGLSIDIPEEKINTKKGQRVLHTKKVTILDDHGHPRYLLGISEDVTDLKQKESQLKVTMEDIERFNRLAVGREERIIELKKEINALALRLGQKPPYDLSFLNTGDQGKETA